jgi:LPS sulfotransferase NodH
MPSSSYFICATPRSGSWLLCGLLASTGLAGRPHEWFLEPVEEANATAWGASDFADYVRLVKTAGTTPNGVFGVKLMWACFESVLTRLQAFGDAADGRALVARNFPSPRFIWIRRQDADAQAVSWTKAIQTGYWHQWDEHDPTAVAVYEREQVNALRRTAAEHDEAWRDWFAANDIEPLIVIYEELVADPTGVARALLVDLHIELRDAPITELTSSTRDRVSAEWLVQHRR